ncbi:polysialyltransferase family glycosyltransferase [Vibrio vulnificus]|uniref:polysialyltransferase family glycosyltransferase n=1 Tax=Vibrio vulnificus TaxID=672 RepID=UPI000BA8C906|nr:polysialyltransferase family glycosyltransferase [Vibrio vulnificus]EGQ7933992.1 hypothetical protein [Vibrio vulnificus]EGQ8001108.1 hypothetical protein [Vibrio vulnificus]EGR0062795.1 hypothetical protein [Vibrio vulnificus]EGR0636218.1 hypothetical protein [Vibrio vulnificus]EIJ0946602.1 hypothetical protein [Vibrio vulnificus]
MNLFLVTSPLQYLCAIEAKKAYCPNEASILLLVKQPREPGISQLAHVLNRNEWTHVVDVERTQRSFSVPKAIKAAIQSNEGRYFKYFFHGEYNAWRTKLILRNLDIDTEVYFDDGSLTLTEYERHIKSKNTFYRPRFINDLVVKLQGLQPIGKLPMSEKLEIFTMFKDLKANVPVRFNCFEELKRKYDITPVKTLDDSKALFLGQGSIDRDGTRKELYLDTIRRFAAITNKPILYAPHRTESEEVRSMVEKIPNLTYHNSSFPIEIEIAERNLNLADVGGISSTALYSLKLIYPNIQIYTAKQTAEDYNNPISFDEVTLMSEHLAKLGVKFF